MSFRDFREVIEIWPKPAPDNMAAEIGVSIENARKWRHRRIIPAKWWSAVLQSRTARRAGLTADDLTRLAAE